MYKIYTQACVLKRRFAQMLLIMRISIFLVVLSLAQVIAKPTLAQKINLSAHGDPLISVFNQISQQSGYDFFISNTTLQKAHPVTIKADHMPLEDVLKQLFSSQPLLYTVEDKTIVVKEKEKSDLHRLRSALITGDAVDIPLQDGTITGRVTDSLGNPLRGATIRFRPADGEGIGSSNASQITITDKEGRFIIRDVPNGASLQISYLGYRSKEISASGDVGSIMLFADLTALDAAEVIVNTGYQSLPKERATGSFSTVDHELFNQQVGTDILSRLPAIANGMLMDAGRSAYTSQMMIRGLSTIRGPKDPLVIVDNFPYDGDIENINPNIVEKVTILKDASASSIWGARAANGVIVITTKTGRFNQPIQLEFNSNVLIADKPDLGYIRQMSSTDYIDMEQELFSRGFYRNKINSSSKPVISPVVDILDKADRDVISEDDARRSIDGLRSLDARDQYRKYLYKPSVNQQYFLSARGGADRFSWTSSAGFDHNKETLGSTYQRINLRFQNTYRPVDKLSVSTGIYYTQTQNNSGRQGYSGGIGLVPYMQIADANGNALPVAKTWNYSYIDTAGNGKLLDWRYYPLTDWQHQTSQSSGTDVLATVAVDYQIIKGLKALVNYQYERQTGMSTGLADLDSYMARNEINRFTQLNGGEPVYAVPVGGILDKSNNLLDANNLRGQLSFDNAYGLHQLSAIAGIEIRSAHNNSHQERFYGYDPNTLSTGNVDYSRAQPTFITGAGAFVQRNQYLGETDTRFVSQFANAAYTYDGRYILSASVRRDGSNLFGLNTNDQWNPFWSAGVAWKLSNERFYSVDFLPYLNFRATYGFSGNIDPAMVAVNTMIYQSSVSTFTGLPMGQFNNYYNPNLMWESSKMLNVALDFKSKNDRISGSVEYYAKNGDHLFGVAPIDYTTGIPPSTLRNVASMKGHGMDVELKTLNLDRVLRWSTTLNFSMYREKVEDYLVNLTTARQYVITGNVPISGVKGRPVYSLYAYRWADLDPNTGEAQGYLDGEVSKNYNSITGTGTKVEDLQYFGSAIPTKFGSLINSLSYKDVSLQFGITFKFGYWFRRYSVNYTTLFNDGVGHSDYASRWQQPGDELITNVPVNLYTTNTNRDAFYNSSSALVEKADHIRLQYINLVYRLKLPNASGRSVKQLQLYVNVNNIGLLWKANKSGIDPDFNTGPSNQVITPTNYALGLRANF